MSEIISSNEKKPYKNKSKSYEAIPAGAGKVPPQAIEVEQAVLGALMLEKDALAKVIDTLKPEVFYKPAHKYIYEAILKLFQNSEPIDLITVTQQLKAIGKLEACGGPLYITQLSARVASAANLEYHAHIIVQKYILREIIRVCGEISNAAFEESTDVFDLLDSAEQQFYALSGNNLRKESLSMDVLALKTLQKLEELKNKGSSITGIPTGFKKLDEMTAGWQKSDLIIVAARPAMGKTAFILSIARNAAVLANKAVAIFSLEMAATQLVQRLLCAEAELDAQKMRTGNLDENEWRQLNAKIAQLIKAPIYIDDTPALAIHDLRAKCRRLKMEKNIDMVVIDYLQLMRAENVKGANREQEIASISRSLKQLAKELEIPVIALSQLSRAVETRGGDKRPMLSDLRESGSIEQDADVVMFLYRPEYYGLLTDEDGNPTQGIAEVIIGKQRNGPVDKVRLQFISRFAKFMDLEGEESLSFNFGPSGVASNFSPSTSSVLAPREELSSAPAQTRTIILPSSMNNTPPDEEDDFEIPF
ncbi:MAG: replicative DNA helicase [Bacteroidia bacterium]|nr:replicative DNA helicase [Bacteroidia bacterium]MDW8159636.1 replicative DNA helicase [Bacteroidia bacterium]